MATGPTLSFNQVQALWVQNGGDPGWAPLAAAIAIAESGGNTVALNNTPATGDYSVGLWQINYFDGLAAGRTAEYGSPAQLQSDPNLQAKAAVKLSGNGTNWGPWKTDPAWNAWQRHGAPAMPSAATVLSWGVSGGGAGGGSSSATTASGAAGAAGSVAAAKGSGCGAKGNVLSEGGILGVGSFTFTYCQVKALVAGVAIAGGLTIALVGTSFMLRNSGAGRAAAGLARAAPFLP